MRDNSVRCSALDLRYGRFIAELVRLFHNNAADLHVEILAGRRSYYPGITLAVDLKRYQLRLWEMTSNVVCCLIVPVYFTTC